MSTVFPYHLVKGRYPRGFHVYLWVNIGQATLFPYIITHIHCLGEHRMVENWLWPQKYEKTSQFFTHILEDESPGTKEPLMYTSGRI